MKRDIFGRGTRYVHKFGEIEGKSDPLGETFDPKFPIFPQSRSGPIERQRHGEHNMFGPVGSPVCKPSGSLASLNGPAPDAAEGFAKPVPQGTRLRLGTSAKARK